MKILPIHPFPARMAPEVALNCIKELAANASILDPMAGSGTVLRHASNLGHNAYGLDTDPLAVLISKVWNTPVDPSQVHQMATSIICSADNISTEVARLGWIDNSPETRKFVEYWFAKPQIADLRKLSFVLSKARNIISDIDERNALDVLMVALSRLIIKKDKGASLAKDVSHSRPHKVYDSVEYDVLSNFLVSVEYVIRQLERDPPKGKVCVEMGDVRSMANIRNGSFDAVFTSPPYLNAIDYIRGHKLALVWLGYTIEGLRKIRSNNIGAERRPDNIEASHNFSGIVEQMAPIDKMHSRHAGMIMRYSEDVYQMMSEIRRVLCDFGVAIIVVGNSCLNGIFVKNSRGIIKAAQMVGLYLETSFERELPANKRYLPLPARTKNPLGKRMRTEVVLRFRKQDAKSCV